MDAQTRHFEKPAVSQPHQRDAPVSKSDHAQNSSQTMAGHRDMRPAVYFKDLKKRSIKLEEEKSEHIESLKKEKRKHHDLPKPSPKSTVKPQTAAPEVSRTPLQKITASYTSKIRMLQQAIKNEDVTQLSDAIFSIKMNRVGCQEEQEDSEGVDSGEVRSLKSNLRSLINQAEHLLIEISAKN